MSKIIKTNVLNRDGNGEYGSILYKGNKYQIYVPQNDNGMQCFNRRYIVGKYINKQYDVIDEVRVTDKNADLFGFLNGECENETKGITLQIARRSYRIEALQCALSIFAPRPLSRTKIDFVFYKSKDNYRKVEIKVSSSDYNTKISQYANNSPISAYWNKEGFQSIECCLMADSSARLYSILTGIESRRDKIYDIEVAIDEKHKDNPCYAYLWIASNGEIMEYPILYPEDKVELGTKNKYYFGDKLSTLFSFNLNASRKAPDFFKNIFNVPKNTATAASEVSGKSGKSDKKTNGYETFKKNILSEMERIT